VDGVAAYSPFSAPQDVVGTAGEALVVRNYVIISSGFGGATAGRWYKSDGDASETSEGMAGGFVISATAAAGDSVTVRLVGRLSGFSGLTAGAVYYNSGTAGEITTSPAAHSRRVGTADSTSSMVIYPSNV
jgi:hypothetical protein